MIRELAERINEAAGNSTPIVLAPARDWDRSGQRFSSVDKARIKLGFIAAVPHVEGIRRTVEWTRANRATIHRCMAQHAHFLPEVRRYG
jgi:nucleoside-diphosphate-sugar epimerase